MSQAPEYVRYKDYSDHQATNPLAPAVVGSDVDAEFDRIKATTDALRGNAALIQRDDGKLRNLSVHPDALSAAVLIMLAGWNPRGLWATATSFAAKDMTVESGNVYVALVAHTSGVFATDLAAGKWQLVSTKGDAGTNGSNGTNGATWYHGTGVPSIGTGATSDFYLNDANGDVYQRTGGGWGVAVANLKGTQGNQGNAGLNGLTLMRRQTVLGGPVTAAGLPNFWPASASGLTLTMQNVTALVPFVATAAGGFHSGGTLDRIGISTSNLAITLPNSSTNYVYADVDANGTLTLGSTTTLPTYQEGGTYAVAAGANTFNISEMVMQAGAGSVAAQVWRVFLGEAVTSGGNISSTVQYAYRGRYDGDFNTNFPSASTAISKNHNIGTYPGVTNVIVECTTTDRGYAVGDRIVSGIAGTDAVPSFTPLPIWTNRNTCGFSVLGGGTAWYGTNKSAFSSGGFTLSSWKYKMTADRGW